MFLLVFGKKELRKQEINNILKQGGDSGIAKEMVNRMFILF